MLLDDDGQAEKMFMEDPSVGAGPGGFRACYASINPINAKIPYRCYGVLYSNSMIRVTSTQSIVLGGWHDPRHGTRCSTSLPTWW